MSPSTIIIAILVFSVLIFVHELGHYISARLVGVRVNEFAMGMGPILFKIDRGETRYSLRAFPIGGFCAFDGEDSELGVPTGKSLSDVPQNPRVRPGSKTMSFLRASVARRAFILTAGSVMNLLLGLVLLGALTAQYAELRSTVVAGFHEGAVSNAWLQPGDKIVRVGNHRINTVNDLEYALIRDKHGVMPIVVERGGERVLLENVTFQMREYGDGIRSIFLDFSVAGMEKTPGRVIMHSFSWTQSIIKMVWGSFIDLITGQYSINQLSGPVGVTTAIGQASTRSTQDLLLLVSFITVNLGIFNLLPLPALDGGRLVFLIIEAIRRKPVNPKYEGLVNAVGFALLIALMIFVTFNDVIQLF